MNFNKIPAFSFDPKTGLLVDDFFFGVEYTRGFELVQSFTEDKQPCLTITIKALLHGQKIKPKSSGETVELQGPGIGTFEVPIS
jgi:hypothetical protein